MSNMIPMQKLTRRKNNVLLFFLVNGRLKYIGMFAQRTRLKSIKKYTIPLCRIQFQSNTQQKLTCDLTALSK